MSLKGFGYIGLVLFCLSPKVHAVTHDSLSVAAEYYYSRHDYRQALQLWSEVYRRFPDNLTALTRVSELKLVFEGRPAATSVVLKHLSDKSESLEVQSREKLENLVKGLQEKFLTEEGQTSYLQALPKIQHEDYSGALVLLQQATTAEKGNLLVLREKAKCEKNLQQYSRFYASLQSAIELSPFDPAVIDELAEAHLYFKEYTAATALYNEDNEVPLSNRQRLAFGYALMETGDTAEAIKLIRGAVESEKGKELSSEVLFALGRLYSKKRDLQSASTQYLEKFVTRMTLPRPLVAETYEPFHLSERVAEAQQLLTELKTTKKYSARSN